ncbi:MAG: glutamate-cysteine ligase family protein, partial [Acidobacteriota bacterium]|nr:glutamate-cysteine ligase family protein [Acidobacteriota bacterium]
HSSRWLRFPLTPERVPFFADAATFAVWMDEQLESGTMQNQRHLWLGIRPNGPATPRVLDRLELRICDRISDPHILQAVTALYEARVWQVLEQPDLDPLRERSSPKLEELAAANERAAGTKSLDAVGVNWVDGRALTFRDWIRSMLDDVAETANRHGFASLLQPLEAVLANGNPAIQWLRRVEQGTTPQQVIQEAIVELAALDREFDPSCPLVA